MIDCINCKYYFNGECHKHPPIVELVNLTSGSSISCFPKVTDSIICGEGKLKDEAGGQEPAMFLDNFQSDWFIINSPFDIIAYDNFESDWFIQNNFGEALFTENYEGVW